MRQNVSALRLWEMKHYKQIINLLHGFGMSIEHNRLLRLETQSANKRASENSCERVLTYWHRLWPPYLLRRHFFFVVENEDFQEDTPNAKRTLHATAIAIYQRSHPSDELLKLEVGGSAIDLSLKELSSIVIALRDCLKPASNPKSPAFPGFNVTPTNRLHQHNSQILSGYWPHICEDIAICDWRICNKRCRNPWRRNSDYLSTHVVGLPHDSKWWPPLTRVSTPPLIAALAHDILLSIN